tara:strand:+ start:355 stop:738 length:384 start_codon:yes stop_codon:yes gene_type:complete
MNGNHKKQNRRYKTPAEMKVNSLVALALYQGAKLERKIYSFKSDDDKVRSGKMTREDLIYSMEKRIVFNPAFTFSIAVFFDNTHKGGGAQPMIKMFETLASKEVVEISTDPTERMWNRFKKQHGING